MTSTSDYSHVVGHRFPGTTQDFPGWLCWLWADTARVSADRARAHPGMAFYAGLNGVGAELQEMFTLIGAGDGRHVMLGECEIEYHQPLQPDRRYRSESEVVGMERKRGRRAGVFDKFSFSTRVRDGRSGELSLICTYAWVVRRPEESS
jgi:hypothetical protein